MEPFGFFLHKHKAGETIVVHGLLEVEPRSSESVPPSPPAPDYLFSVRFVVPLEVQRRTSHEVIFDAVCDLLMAAMPPRLLPSHWGIVGTGAGRADDMTAFSIRCAPFRDPRPRSPYQAFMATRGFPTREMLYSDPPPPMKIEVPEYGVDSPLLGILQPPSFWGQGASQPTITGVDPATKTILTATVNELSLPVAGPSEHIQAGKMVYGTATGGVTAVKSITSAIQSPGVFDLEFNIETTSGPVVRRLRATLEPDSVVTFQSAPGRSHRAKVAPDGKTLVDIDPPINLS